MLHGATVPQNIPWCVMGDFNDMFDASERKGPNSRLQAFIDGFWLVVEDCSLVDVPMVGYPFTWARAKGKPRGMGWMVSWIGRW
ncbi:hypothetical protein LINPERHAP1_LOCUS34603 [Linum perenne]